MKHVQSVPHGVALERGSERLLRWLERYPLQRAQDLIVALAPWEKRTVVYERLADLERQHLVETLHSGTTGKKLYHLSPLGAYVCDQLAERSDEGRRERWERSGSTQVVRQEREKLMRLLPRLPVLLLMQDLVNGLVVHASAALTQHGRRAKMVQWTWQRDYGHAFLTPHQKVFHLRVEGALTLCLRYAPAGPLFAGETVWEENWHTLLLLHCPLDEVRLMRMRLDRLLRWRESAERTAVYNQMPALLILATTERQAEWWHQVAVQAAVRLRASAPIGAVACLPEDAETLSNGWRLSWRRLGTKEHCHLQDMLHPFPLPAIPELLAGRGSASESVRSTGTEQAKGRVVPVPARLHSSAYALGGRLVAKRSDLARRRKQPPASYDYRLASLGLTPRHWEILGLFFAHPFLGREDLTLLLALSRTTVNLLLADLQRARYLSGVGTPVGERWCLAEEGLYLLARLALCHVHRLAHYPVEDETSLQQRGVPGLLHQIHHTAGVYSFFALLGEQAQLYLRWWETGPLSERHFRYAEKTYRFRPDALAVVQFGSHQLRFWLEWDRGTMTLKDLRLKFTTYAMYLVSREWARSSPYLPALLCVTPEIGQERRVAEAARQCLVHVPAAFRLYTTTAHLLATSGIMAPIWQHVVLANQQTLSSGRRMALFESNEQES